MGHGGSFIEVLSIPLELLFFIMVAFLLFKTISKVLPYFERNGNKDETELFSMVIIFILVLAALSETLQIGYLIGSIIGGFLLQISMRSIDKKHKREMMRARHPHHFSKCQPSPKEISQKWSRPATNL